MDKINTQKEIFRKIISCKWNGKEIWEHIRDLELAATPAFKGKYYDEANTKIMFIGRALNGWEENLLDCSSVDSVVESVFNQKDKLDTIICKEGFKSEQAKRTYYHKNQKFFRFIKGVLEAVGESEDNTDLTWYDDKLHWNQKFVWTNLFCISKRSPKSMAEANPTSEMIKPSIGEYVDLMECYIRHYKPDVAVFITDIDGWFIPWKRERSFKELLDVDTYVESRDGSIIVARGYIDKTLVLICKRPDGKKSYTFNDVKTMASIVGSEINKYKTEELVGC